MGKTYLFYLLLNEVREGSVGRDSPALVLAEARSGVAALYLRGGRTAPPVALSDIGEHHRKTRVADFT